MLIRVMISKVRVKMRTSEVAPYIQSKPWGPFLIRMALIAFVICGGIYWFRCSYYIGVDSQPVKCIPGVNFVIGKRGDRAIHKNAIYAVRSRGLGPIYKDGTVLVKFLRATPGDTVKISKDGIFINGKRIADADFPLAKRLGHRASYFYGQRVLGKDQYWVMGSSPLSFDSRYWGPIHYEQFVSRVHPFF